MAETASRNDPLASFNFIIDIQGVRAGFAEVSGLSGETKIIEYREGTEDITPRKVPGQRVFTNLMLKRGFTPDGKDLWEWRKSVMEGRTQRLSGTITLLNEAREAALVWRFYEAWPTKWNGPAFNAKNNDIAIEELEIAHEGLELET